jgi:hypothetical protein
MPRKLEHSLTSRAVQTAGPGRHCDGGGLYLQVVKSRDGESPEPIKDFSVPRRGQLREMGLGSLSTMRLSETGSCTSTPHETAR